MDFFKWSSRAKSIWKSMAYKMASKPPFFSIGIRFWLEKYCGKFPTMCAWSHPMAARMAGAMDQRKRSEGGPRVMALKNDYVPTVKVQKPRDIITGLRYSNSCRYLLGTRLRNLILARLASIVTTSLKPFNDIKPISAPLTLRSRPGLRQDKQANGGNLTSSGKKLALPRLAVR